MSEVVEQLTKYHIARRPSQAAARVGSKKAVAWEGHRAKTNINILHGDPVS
jgi:hypothetical protein